MENLKELKEKAIDKKKVDKLEEIHRPWIDEIKLRCPGCKNEMKRVEAVGDAWLDAGIVPFSTIGPYLENKKEWDKWFKGKKEFNTKRNTPEFKRIYASYLSIKAYKKEMDKK